MKKYFRGFSIALIAAAIMFPQTSAAASGWVRGAKVVRVQATHDRFGQCMAFLSSTNSSLSCSAWVTFDCDGSLDGNTKAAGNTKFNAAQLAMVTSNKVNIFISDSKKINGQCFAERLQVFAN